MFPVFLYFYWTCKEIAKTLLLKGYQRESFKLSKVEWVHVSGFKHVSCLLTKELGRLNASTVPGLS